LPLSIERPFEIQTIQASEVLPVLVGHVNGMLNAVLLWFEEGISIRFIRLSDNEGPVKALLIGVNECEINL
jgi:hypothetical protein